LCARHNWRHMNETRGYFHGACVHRREHPDHDRVVRTDSDFADRPIGQELDTRHCWRRSSNMAVPPSSKARPYSVVRRRGGCDRAAATPIACSRSAIDLETAAAWCQDFAPPCSCSGLDDGHQHVKIVQFHRRPIRSLNCILRHPMRSRYGNISK